MQEGSDKTRLARSVLSEKLFLASKAEIARIRRTTSGRILAFGYSLSEDGLDATLDYLVEGDRSRSYAGRNIIFHPHEWPTREHGETYECAVRQQDTILFAMEEMELEDDILTDEYKSEIKENTVMMSSIAGRLREGQHVNEDEKFVLIFPHEEQFYVDLEAEFVAKLNTNSFYSDWVSFRGASR